MTTAVALGLSVLVLLVALRNWRAAMLLILLAGVLADPLRKLTPGIPSYYVVWPAALYLAVLVIAVLARDLPPVERIFLGWSSLRTAWTVFGAIVVVHLGIALVRWGSPVVPLFGALFYGGPVLAMLLGYALATGEHNLWRFVRTYCWLFVPAALTIYLSPGFEDRWPVLREVGAFVGQELVIFDVGTRLQSYSGIFRVGETAAWHAGTAASFLVLLAVVDRNPVRRILYLALVIVLIGAIFYTGRRKMLMNLTIFVIGFWALTAGFRGLGAKVSLVVIALGTALSYSLTLLDPASEQALYVQRGATVFGEVDDRLRGSAQLLSAAFQRAGVMGLGAGAASQGIGYAGVDVSAATGGAGEAGVGKLVLELGLIGLVAATAVLALTVRQLLRGLSRLVRVDPRLFLYSCAFQALLFANVMTFMVATQVYGDFFILLVLGTLAGFVLRFYWLGITLPFEERSHATD